MRQIPRIPEIGLIASLRLLLPGADEDIFTLPSRTFFTGIQYDPVLSIATLVQPSWTSHSRSCSKAGTVVPNARVFTSPSWSAGPVMIATASSLLPTSIPAHRSITAGISIISSLLCAKRAAGVTMYTLPRGP